MNGRFKIDWEKEKNAIGHVVYAKKPYTKQGECYVWEMTYMGSFNLRKIKTASQVM